MPWNDPIPLTRAWCIWEILSTIAGLAKLEICLPAVEQEAFAKFLVDEGADQVIVKMVKIDVQRAEAFKKEDRDAILDAVKKFRGGPSEVNKLIKDEMLATPGVELWPFRGYATRTELSHVGMDAAFELGRKPRQRKRHHHRYMVP